MVSVQNLNSQVNFQKLQSVVLIMKKMTSIQFKTSLKTFPVFKLKHLNQIFTSMKTFNKEKQNGRYVIK
jgi:hypothetical protein